MSERDEKQIPARTLEYATPNITRKKPWPLKWKIALVVLLLFTMGMTILMYGGIIEPSFAMYRVNVLIIIIFALFSFVARSKSKGSVYSEENEEKLWQEREAHKREMVEISRRLYAIGPIGTWRYADIEYRQRSVPIVHEERIFLFEINGKGRYIWRKSGKDSVNIGTLFDYKLEREGILTVQISSPPKEGWNPVEFGLESRRDGRGELDLFVWFESDNPLPPDFKEHWPFWGEFQRSTK